MAAITIAKPTGRFNLALYIVRNKLGWTNSQPHCDERGDSLTLAAEHDDVLTMSAEHDDILTLSYENDDSLTLAANHDDV